MRAKKTILEATEAILDGADHAEPFTIVVFERERRNAQGVLGKA